METFDIIKRIVLDDVAKIGTIRAILLYIAYATSIITFMAVTILIASL
jgi:hypothetical protein